MRIGISPETDRRLAHELLALAVADDRGRARVGEHVGELVALDRRVDGRERGPGAEHAVDRDGGLGAVREHERDAVAPLDARLEQSRREPVREAVQLAVRERPLARHDRLPRRVARRRGAQVLSERAGAQPELRFRSTYAAMASIEPKFSSVISTSSTVTP